MANNVSVPSVALRSLQPGSRQLFTFRGYDFGAIIGTSVISFGRSTDSQEEFICLIGQRAGEIQGWRLDIYFFIFSDRIDTVATQVVVVSRLATRNYIRLLEGDERDVNSPRPNDLFYFHAGKR